MNLPRDFSDINWLHNLWQKAVMDTDMFDIHVQWPKVVFENN